MSAVNPFQPYLPPPITATPSVRELPQAAGGVPQGDGTFSANAAGTAPDSTLDFSLALMANDSYAADNPKTEAELAAAGWNRLQENGDGTALVDAQGNEIPIDPALLGTGNGMDAAIYQNADGQYVVAYRGTDDWGVSQGADSDDNGGQGLGFDSPQYSDAIALAQRAEQVFGEGNVVTTGHSLGGGLASAAALATGSTGVTFNASGLSNRTLESLGFNPNAVRDLAADSGQIRRYAVDGDPLTAAQEDIPLLPVVGSPADAVGHALRVAPPAGLGFDLAALHGGGGDGASYVESLRENTPYDPGITGSVFDRGGRAANDALDTAGDHAGAWISSAGDTVEQAMTIGGQVIRITSGPLGPVTGALVDTAAPVVGALADGTAWVVDNGLDLLGDGVSTLVGTGGDIAFDVLHNAGEFQLNQIGNLARTVTDFGGDAIANGSETLSGIQDAISTQFSQGDVLAGTGRVVGDVLDGTIDTLGDAASGVVGFAGDTVQNLTDAGGGLLRDVGKELGIEGVTAPIAGFVEGFGSTVSHVADGAGEVIDTVTDAIGDGAEAVSDFAGDAAQAVSDGAGWLADKLNPFD